MDVELKIGAVFSLAPDDIPPTSGDDTSDKTAIAAEDNGYSEMTADDCDITVNNGDVSQNETDDIITGADPEMNSSNEVNDLEIDVEGDVSTESAFSDDGSGDNPPELAMEENVGVLPSVYPDELVEALPPPVLSPVMNAVEKTSVPDVQVKEEPMEYDAAYEWTPAANNSPPIIDRKPKTTETKKKCTKIYPCYIVLTDIAHYLIGDDESVSYRFIRSLRKTECSNMCKKMYFRRRLKAGRNVFNVKTPSSVEKRSKHLEKIGEQDLSPKSKSGFTKLKVEFSVDEAQLKDSVILPKMFLRSTGVTYSVDKVVEDKINEINALKRQKTTIEKDVTKMQIKKEKEELRIKEEAMRERELRSQLDILLEQVKIKREENFHRKLMRKKKKDLPYLKPSVSARSGRVIKPNALYDDNMYAFNNTDIQGYRKLSALKEKQRKVLAEMKQKENKAKRVSRVVLPPPKGVAHLRDMNVKGTFDQDEPKQKVSSHADLEIDNPEKDDGVRTLEICDKKPRIKRKMKTEATGEKSENMKKPRKKPRKTKHTIKSDGVLINDFPDTETVVKYLQGGPKVQKHGMSNGDTSQVSGIDNTGAEKTSVAYPFARSLLASSKHPELKGTEAGKPHLKDLMKGVMVIDAQEQKPVRFQVGTKQVMMAKHGGKLVFFKPEKQFKTKRIPTNWKQVVKSTTDTEARKLDIIPVTSALTVASTAMTDTSVVISSSTLNSQTATATAKTSIPVSNVVIKPSTGTPNLIPLPFPLMSAQSKVLSYIPVPASQSIIMNPKPNLLGSPGIISNINASSSVALQALHSLLPQTALSTISSSTATQGQVAVPAPSPMLMSVLAAQPKATTTVAGSGTQPTQKLALFSPTTSQLVPIPKSSSVNVSQLSSNTTTASHITVNSSGQAAQVKNSSSAPVSSSVKKLANQSIAQKQASTTQQKGKFYLLKVDGKHILIPIPGSTTPTDKTVQTKAYLVNDKPSANKEGKPCLNSVTPLPTQTVSVPLQSQVAPDAKPKQTLLMQNVNGSKPKQTGGVSLATPNVNVTGSSHLPVQRMLFGNSHSQNVVLQPVGFSNPAVSSPVISKPFQTTLPYSASMPIMSYKVVTGNSPGAGPASLVPGTCVSNLATTIATETSVTKTSKVTTHVQPSLSTAAVVVTAAEPVKGVPVLSGSSSESSTTTVTGTLSTVAATSEITKPHSRSLLHNYYSYNPKVTKRKYVSSTNSEGGDVNAIDSNRPPPIVVTLCGPMPDLRARGDNSYNKVKFYPAPAVLRTPVKPAVIVHSLPILESNAEHHKQKAINDAKERNGNLNSETENKTDKSEDKMEVRDETETKPFSEAVTDREEKLRKLKELLKQKNKAVEEIRKIRNKTSTEDEKGDADGAEV